MAETADATPWRNWIEVDRPWDEYPLGTKAHAVMGGHWLKTERGWKWCTGDTFSQPGDAFRVTLPPEDSNG